MKKALKRLENVGGPLSPQQFDAVMAQFAPTQAQRSPAAQRLVLPRRSPGSLEAKPNPPHG